MFLIVSLALIGLMVDSCKSKKQEIPPFIDVHLEVKDANNVPSTGATVYLYNTEEAFQAAYQNSLNLKYNSNGSILTTTISGGKLDLKGLPSNTGYWVLVHDTSEYFLEDNKDTILQKIDKDNSEAYYKIDGFQNGTTVLANITLQPVSSLIKFVNAQVATEPITDFRMNDKIEKSAIPTTYTKIRKGTVGYQARNSTCVWTGEIEAIGGKAVAEPLVECLNRKIIFKTQVNLVIGQTIDIYIGQNKSKPIGTLTPQNISDTIILSRGINYAYFAEFKIGDIRKCVYEGKIGESLLEIVELKPCN